MYKVRFKDDLYTVHNGIHVGYYFITDNNLNKPIYIIITSTYDGYTVNLVDRVNVDFIDNDSVNNCPLISHLVDYIDEDLKCAVFEEITRLTNARPNKFVVTTLDENKKLFSVNLNNSVIFTY